MNRVFFSILLFVSMVDVAFGAKTVETKSHNWSALGSDQSIFMRPSQTGFPNAYIYSGGLNATSEIYPDTTFSIGNDGVDFVQFIEGAHITAFNDLTVHGSTILDNGAYFKSSSGSPQMQIKGPLSGISTTVFLPGAVGGANTFLRNDGGGNLTWATAGVSTIAAAGSIFGPVASPGGVISGSTLALFIANGFTDTSAGTQGTGVFPGIISNGSQSIPGLKQFPSGIALGQGTSLSSQVFVTLRTNSSGGSSHSLFLPSSQGGAGTYLQNNGSGTLSWAAVPTAVTTVGSFSGSSQSNGASISGATITFGPADTTNPGMVSTGAQTWAGAKTIQLDANNKITVDPNTQSMISIRGNNNANYVLYDALATSGGNQEASGFSMSNSIGSSVGMITAFGTAVSSGTNQKPSSVRYLSQLANGTQWLNLDPSSGARFLWTVGNKANTATTGDAMLIEPTGVTKIYGQSSTDFLQFDPGAGTDQLLLNKTVGTQTQFRAKNNQSNGYANIVVDNNLGSTGGLQYAGSAGAFSIALADQLQIYSTGANGMFLWPQGGSLYFGTNGTSSVTGRMNSVDFKLMGIGLAQNRTAVVDTDSSLANGTGIVGVTALTAPRTMTLPAAANVSSGHMITVKDEDGSVTPTNTITVSRSGSDTIDGATSAVISSAYGSVSVYSDGVSKWATVSAPIAVTTVGTIDTAGPSANGLTITGSSIFAQSASGTNPGLMNTTAQTIAGAKTFSTSIITPTVQNTDGTAGSALTVRSGTGTTSAGGALTVNGGDTSSSGTGGAITARGGTSATGTGGAATFQAGTGTAGVGGILTVRGGTSNSASTGPASNFIGATNTGGGAGGALSINAGSTNTAGAGGHLRFSGGGSTSGTPGSIQFFFPNGSTTFANTGMVLDEKGNVTIAPAAVATNATDRFLYLSGTAGTPTGVPTSKTGSVPLVYDTTNSLLYAYNSSWLALVGATATQTLTNKTLTSPVITTPTGFVEVFTGFMEGPTDKSYTIDEYAKYAYTINDITLKTASGTTTAAVAINGTPVTGLSAISVTSTQSTTSASAANTVAIGDRVTITLSSSSTPVDLAFTQKVTR